VSAWEFHGQLTAFPQAALEGEFAVKGLDPVHNVGDADTFSGVRRFEALPVISQVYSYKMLVRVNADMNGGGAGVFENIGDLLLYDAINIQLQIGVDGLRRHAIVEFCLYDGVLIEVIDQRLDQLPQVQSALGRDLVPCEEP